MKREARKMRKRSLAYLLGICMLISMFSGVVYADNMAVVSSENGDGLSSVEAPEVSITHVINSGKIHLTWTEAESAVEYQIYRRMLGADEYLLLAVTANTVYTDNSAVEGETYTYHIIPVTSEGQVLEESAGYAEAICKLARPVIAVSNKATTGKIMLNWKDIEGAIEYEVYRCAEEDGIYEWLGNTTESSYVDIEAQAEERYYYKVMALAEDSRADSVMSEAAEAICVLARPTITLSNTANTGKIKITWGKVAGAQKYKLYAATSKNGSYSLLKTVTGTSHTHNNGVAGKTYYYKVMAIASDGEANSAFSTVKSRMCDCAKPEIKVSGSSATMVKVSWNKVKNAQSYIVYRATSKNGEYKKVATVTAPSYTDKKVTAQKTYYYKIVAKASNSNANSVASNIVKAKAVPAAPVMKVTANATKTSIKISWNKVNNADGYYVYRKTSQDGSWKKIATITSVNTLNYTDKDASGNYYYSVASFEKVNGTRYRGDRSEAIRVCTLGKPTIGVTSGDSLQDVVKWNKITGATGYQIYHKVQGGNWKRVATVGKVTSYTYDVGHGVSNYYKVRPIYKNNGVTTLGPFSKVYDAGFWYYDPNYTTVMSDEYDKSAKTAVIFVTNNGVANMRFFAEGGRWLDHDFEKYDRDIILYDYDEYEAGCLKKTAYVDIAPGESGYILVGVVGEPTWYDEKTRIVLDMYYDGIYYRTYTSSYYGSNYYMYE